MTKPRKHKGCRNHIIAFLITIVGTFSGVFLAFLLNGCETQREEKKRLYSYYEVMIYDLSRYKQVLDNLLEQHEKGVPVFGEFNPFEEPKTPDLFIGEGELYKYMSSPLRRFLFEYSRNYREIMAFYRLAPDPELKGNIIRFFKRKLETHIIFLKDECKYLFGRKTDEDMELLFNKLLTEEEEFRKRMLSSMEESSISKPKGQ